MVRQLLLATLALGLAGTEIELLLLGHVEGFWQLAPVVLIGIAIVLFGWLLAGHGRTSVRVFQAAMLLFLVSGLLGVWLHYQGNVEFELELHRTMAGFELFRAAMSGATPALAPGTMIVLGLVGITYTLVLPPKGGSHENERR